VVHGQQEAYIGDSKLLPVDALTSVPPSPPSSPGEMVWVEVSRVALKEGSASGALTQEKTVEVPVPLEAAGANMTPSVNDVYANEVEPQAEDAPDGASLILGSPMGPGFNLPRGTALDDLTSIPRSLDIVDMGAGELRLPGCPKTSLLPTS
jgi:hypothetical protein